MARALERTREDGALRVLRSDGSPDRGEAPGILVEPVLPSVQLLVLGAGPDAEPIVAIAGELSTIPGPEASLDIDRPGDIARLERPRAEP